MLEGLMAGGYDLPSFISESSVRNYANKHSIATTAPKSDVQARVEALRSLTPEARDMLEGLIVGGYDLPALITEGSVRSFAKKHSITG